MPTENRSSNTREQLDALWRDIQDSALRSEDPPHVRFAAALVAQPSPQPHPEPIAWMVGTAFWWTKEEAERDAAATGLPIVGLGPMAGAVLAEQRQSEPSLWRFRASPDRPWNTTENLGTAQHARAQGFEVHGFYTHADPGEVEQLRNELGEAKGEYDRSVNKVADLRNQLDEWNAALECMTTTATSYKSELANRDALLQRMKTLFRTDDPLDLYDAVCNALVGKF